MSLINDLLSDLHARDALPAGREPLSGLSPVQHPRVNRAWLLPAGTALFAASAWAVIQVDDTRGVDAVSTVVETIDMPDVAAPTLVAKAAANNEHTTGKLTRPEPRLMLDTHLLSIERLGAAWQPARTAVAAENQITVNHVATEPVPVRSMAASVPDAGPISAPPTTTRETSGIAPLSMDAKASSTPAKIRTKNPHDTALAALTNGRPQDAESRFQQLTIENPGNTQAWLYLARARSAQNRDADAELALMTALNVVDDPAPIARALARRLVTRNGISEALKLLEAYRPEGRLEPDHDAFIAALHQRLGRHDVAAERYRGILAVRPETAAWWVGLAISEEARGHGAAALDAYQHARNLGNLDSRLADYATRRITAMQGTGSS